MNKSALFGALLHILLLFPCGILHAESLDEQQARFAAAEFFSPSSQSSRLRAQGRQLVLRSNGHEQGFYIFDRPEGGIVFVADDDAIGRTVLGYSDSGSYDADNLPIGLQDWLEQIGILMDAVHAGKISRANVRQGVRTRIVDRLIKTTWNQSRPYNNLCPSLDGKRCITGCVATAMAQVMKYWKWPKHGYGSVTYDDDGCGQTLSTNLSAHNYDWENMLDSYSGSYTEEEANAVATLMRDCGYAVQMNYTPEASGACVFAETMQQYFHYSPAAKDRYAGDYSEDAWHEFIRQDLLAGRPVLYSGQSSKEGHEFILDGFDDEDYYHVNWGWGGYMDGWFMLTDLYGYNAHQTMINHLMPDSGDDSPFTYTFSEEDGVLTINGKGMMPEEYKLETAPWRTDCDKIRKIVINKGITNIVENFDYAYKDDKQYRFNNLEELILPEGLLSIGRYAFTEANNLTSVQLPSTLAKMDYAFYGCKNLKSLHLPKSLEEYEDRVPGLAELSIDEDNPRLTVEDNLLYTKNCKQLLFVPGGLKRITIAETTELIFDIHALSYGIPIVFKGKTPPDLPNNFLESYAHYLVSSLGYIFAPYGSSGYESWQSFLPAEWRIMTYLDIDHLPDNEITWTQDGGTLTISGWAEQKYQEFGYSNAPYYQNSSQIQKLVVEEGVLGLCNGGFAYQYDNLTEAELPSTLSYIGNNCFSYSGLNTITSYARTAPTLGTSVFRSLPESGTLRVPQGTRSSYSAWLQALPNGWEIEEFEAEALCSCQLYTGETSAVYEQKEWGELLKQHPNAVGVTGSRYKAWAYMMPNALFQDATAPGGYTCPYFQLTDLSYGYATTEAAPLTGFTPSVPFSIIKGEYKRKLAEGYNSVCLPFAIKAEDLPESIKMYAYSYFDSEGSDAIFTQQASTEAGQACFLRCKYNVEWQTDLSGRTIATLQASVSDDNMRGTFVSTEDYQGIGYSPRAKDNVFAPLAQHLHPFRACFIIDTPSAPAEVRICLSDDATGLSDVSDKSDLSDGIFNLSGQRLNKAQKGINIIDGKKIVK